MASKYATKNLTDSDRIEVESLYIKHHNNEFFRALIEAYTSYDHIDYDYDNNLRIFFLS